METYFGLVISFLFFELGSIIFKKTKSSLASPLLIATICCIAFLCITGISYATYNIGAKYITFFLTPTTICLAVPLYEQTKIVTKNIKIILLALFTGVLTCSICALVFATIFGFGHQIYLSLLLKSITVAIGIPMTEELNGIPALTSAFIVSTGITGNIVGEKIFKLFKIKSPVAQGLALGITAHGMGTSRALEMGDVQGAFASLSIVCTGIFTVLVVPFISNLI